MSYLFVVRLRVQRAMVLTQKKRKEKDDKWVVIQRFKTRAAFSSYWYSATLRIFEKDD